MTFDDLAKLQKQLRDEAEFCSFFVKHGFVTEDEAVELYRWFSREPSLLDDDGHIRAWLVKMIPVERIPEIVDLKELGALPRRIRQRVKTKLEQCGGPNEMGII